MAKALIVARVHKPEGDFGAEVIKYFKANLHSENILYRSISNNNGTRGGCSGRFEKANKIAYAEVVEKINETNPSLLIDIHCTIPSHERYRADIAARDYSRLVNLANMPWIDANKGYGEQGVVVVYDWGIQFQILPDMIKTHPTMNYVGLEIYLDRENNHSDHKPEVEFTGNLIKKILDCEKNS